MTVAQKIIALRQLMKEHQIDAFIVYNADPHMSEYLPQQWQERSWISGFTGSAGWIVVTQDKAGLWTDSRYFVQAEMELQNSGITLFKEGLDDTPDYVLWLAEEVPAQGVVAVNALTTSHQNWETLRKKLSLKNISLVHRPLLSQLWSSRDSACKKESVFVHPQRWAGKSATEKIANIRQEMQCNSVDYHIITALDEVAWTLNLRGSDVDFNPVFLGYLILGRDSSHLFVNLEQLNSEAKQHLEQNQVIVNDYDSFFPFLENIKNQKVWVSPTSNQAIFEALRGNRFLLQPSPAQLMKAVKNLVELEGFRKVMVRDGVALVNFFYWLTHSVGKETLTEFSIGEKLHEFRAQGENFVGDSFGCIVGYEGNGAIVHYSAKKDSCKEVFARGSILIDSGGQYLEGTTDITRTLALGEVSEEFKKDSTLVLKGLIQLSKAHFPVGTRGVQLDTLARLPLWSHHKDYGHGTGHGVGSFMNVHEGPQNIRKELNPQRLLPGMVCSNEPGFYKKNQYGIRHENLVAVTRVSEDFLAFETLTICPFFVNAFDKHLLTEEEILWINQYHQMCREKLEPFLRDEVRDWFLTLVQPISL